MSHISETKAGRFTTLFTCVAAGDVQVAGLPAGSAGLAGVPLRGLSTMAGMFAVTPDTMQLMQAMLRPATEIKLAA